MASNRRKSQHAAIRQTTLARSVRHALVLGLAMATSAPAFAGTCNVVDPAAATCDGVFSGINISYAIEDLTLVVGGDLATTIDPITGLAGIELHANYGGIHLVSYADIHTQGASGIQAQSYYGDVDIDNFGLVDASTVYYGNATGIRASSFFAEASVYVADGSVVSASTDNVYGGTATGVRASSYLGGAAVQNLGDVSADADADYGNATAYGVLGRGGYYGITSIDNAGSIAATASTGSGVGWAWGVRARGRYAELENSGSISAEAYAGSGYASASAAYVRGQTSSSSNAGTGDIEAHAVVGGHGQALAYGTMTWGYYAELENQGRVAAYADVGSGTSVAMGANSYYDRTLSVYNAGSFLGDAYAGLGIAEAVGVSGYAQYNSTLVNAAGGDIHAVGAVGNGYAFGYGILFDAGTYGRVDNAGTIRAEATTYDSGAYGDHGGLARSIGASLSSEFGDALLYNAQGASILADSDVYGEYGRSYAFGAVAQGANQARLVNEGTISASAYSEAGDATVLGDLAYGTFAVNLNYGDVLAHAGVEGAGFAMAIGQYSFGQVSTVWNEGSTQVSASVGEGEAYAIGARLNGAWVGAYNYSELVADAHADSGLASAQGVEAYGFYGASASNAAHIAATASVLSGQAEAVGVYAFAYVYGAYASNAGDIVASAATGEGAANATGVVAISYLFGPVGVDNTAHILATATGPGDATATGIAMAVYEGDVVVRNDGDVDAIAHSLGGSYGTADATGLHVDYYSGKYNLPVADIRNLGDIVATATRGGEYGFAMATGASVFAMYAGIYNAGQVVATANAQGAGAGASSLGMMAFGKYAVEVDNTGDIRAFASADGGGSASASGVGASAYYGTITLHNEGDISAEALATGGEYGGTAYAGGVHLHGDYATALHNLGSISARASAAGSAEATGFDGSTKYDLVELDNQGEILAFAQGYHASATGSRISSKYGAHSSNDELIAAYAQAGGHGSALATGSITLAPGAHGYFETAIGAALYNDDRILAQAEAEDGEARALGARVEGAQDAGAYTGNHGVILARAQSESGSAYATGSSTWSYYGDVGLVNRGDILAYASVAGSGEAAATGALVRAQGFGPPGYPAGFASLDNKDTIRAVASSVHGDAYASAALVVGEQGVRVDNSGRILAAASGAADSVATALALYSHDANLLYNEGEIAATGAGSAHVAVHSNDAAKLLVENRGDIRGSILAGARDDFLHNLDGGVLWLANDIIDLGAWSSHGNRFVNDGLIVVNGDGNAIGMGMPAAALLPGANPEAFVNDGAIDFVDGTVDDTLQLTGSLAGDGVLAFDVDAAEGIGDALDIAGDVDRQARQSIDVHLLGLPTQASSLVPLVTVAGESRAGNFQLGDVGLSVDPGFLALDFGLEADIDATGQRPDAFRLQVEVAGLSDAGAMAAAVPAAVGQLLAAQVGGERARLPASDGKQGPSLWARTFHSKAEVRPEHEAMDFGQGGNFAFDQRSVGVEAGLDLQPAESWRLGALLFDMHATPRLHAPGVGGSRVEGDGYGLYAGGISPRGLQFEAAWRHLRYEAEVAGGSGRGTADSLDLQASRAWNTKGGMRVEPQLQFTHARITGVDGLSAGGTDWRAKATDSSLARAGVLLGRSFGDDARRWTPFLGLSALHEFDGDSRYRINGDFSGRGSTGGTSVRGEAGFDATLGALALTGSVRWQDGGALSNVVDLQFNLRYRW